MRHLASCSGSNQRRGFPAAKQLAKHHSSKAQGIQASLEDRNRKKKKKKKQEPVGGVLVHGSKSLLAPLSSSSLAMVEGSQLALLCDTFFFVFSSRSDQYQGIFLVPLGAIQIGTLTTFSLFQ